MNLDRMLREGKGVEVTPAQTAPASRLMVQARTPDGSTVQIPVELATLEVLNAIYGKLEEISKKLETDYIMGDDA